uniref:DUF1279 domain-containing protein n=1 Tax=Kalanchoe fedtschenkoi TaxID=63787 RepID=A0A7N0R977_KALFE
MARARRCDARSSPKSPTSESESESESIPTRSSPQPASASLIARFMSSTQLHRSTRSESIFSVSAASITGFYLAIKSNVDVESIMENMGMSVSKEAAVEAVGEGSGEREVVEQNQTAEMAATSVGAIALAIMSDKALFPDRVSITVALMPPIARFLARRRVVQNSVCS